MKKLNVFLLLFLFVLAGQQASAQLLVKEDLNYNTVSPNNKLLGKTNPWTNTTWTQNYTGADQYLVTTDVLQYTGYPGGTNKTRIETNGTTNIALPFASVSSGSVYCSFLLNPTKGGTESAGTYFLAFAISATASASSWRSVVYIREKTIHGDSCKLGIGSDKNGATWMTDSIAKNKVHLVVLKQKIVSGPTNDSIFLAVDPAATTVEPTTWNVKIKNASSDINPTVMVLRGRNAGTAAPSMSIGGFRIAKSWADLFEPINSSVNKLSGFKYWVDNGPSAEQSFTVIGSNLTGDITVTPPTHFEISTTSGSGFTSSALTLTQAGGVVAATTLYVRMKSGLAVGTYSGESIVLSSTGYNNVNVTCSGIVGSPAISSTPTTVTGLNYSFGNGPSTSKSFNVSGSFLTEDITVIPPANFEISLTANGTYQETALILPQVSGEVVSTLIYVRLKTGLAKENYTGNITLTSTGATPIDVFVSGAVGLPIIFSTPTSIAGLNYKLGYGPSISWSFNVSGSFLTENIIVTPPSNFEISLAAHGTYQKEALILAQMSGEVPTTPIYVRLKTGLGVGSYNDSVLLSSNGALTKSVVCNGSVSPTNPLLVLEENFCDIDTLVGLLNPSINMPWVEQQKGSTFTPITVSSGNLTYPDYFSSGIGNKVRFLGNGNYTAALPFSKITGGTVYLSFLINISNAGTGGYCMGFGANPVSSTIYNGRLNVKKSGSKIAFGISRKSGVSWTGLDYDLNTTYLIVMKHQIYAGSANDTCSIIINPVISSTEPDASSWLKAVDYGTDYDIGSIYIRSGTGSNNPTGWIDGIKVATSWNNLMSEPIDNQLMHLPPYTEGKPRINRSEYTAWPANHGDAHVTLWDDDKFAALTVTIDDNWVSDHPAWLELQQKYGFVATWFCMTRKNNNWQSFQNMMNHGNDVQSHTTNHKDYRGLSPDSVEIDSVYRLSVVDINTNLTEGRCLTIAYPFGWADFEIASKYFIGGRGVGGMVNKADNINYMCTGSGFANDTQPVDALLNPNVLINGKSFYRDWLCMHYHGMNGGEENYFSHLAQKQDSIWVTWFRNVILFGQERDSHTLTMKSVSDSKIRFDLTDLMVDSIYDYPLTVKVRVNNDWEEVNATQNGFTIPSKVINHEGNLYVLVKAIPDRGLIEINKGWGSNVFKVRGIGDIKKSLNSDVSQTGEHAIKLITYQNHLKILGTVKGDLIDIYNLKGVKLKSIVATGNESIIELKSNQIVLVRIKHNTFKVVL